MDQQQRDEMLGILCQMSDRQVDPQAKARIKALIGRTNEDIKDELLGVIDDIVFCAWTSDFEIKVLNAIWLSVGGTEEEGRNPQRTLNTEENRAKYKWAFSRG